MPIDASIPLGVKPVQIENPMNMLAKVMQIQGLQQEQGMNALKMDEYRRGTDETGKLNALYATALGPDGKLDRTKLLSGAATRGLGSKIPGLQKGFLEEDKGTAELENKKAGTAKTELESTLKKFEHGASVLSQVKDPASYATARTMLNAQLGMNLPEQYDPAMVQATIAQGQTITQQLAAKHQQMTLQETSRHNTTSEALTQRGQDVTVRGQNMVDARSRETTAAAMSKPFEITGEDGKPVLVQQDKQGNIHPVDGFGPKQGASKPLTDTQAKALQFGSRMQATEDVFGELSGRGVITSIPGSRGGMGQAINALQPADRQRLDQAKRDFINAVLRRESGAAISPSEFDSAEKQYFPQVGETDPAVLAQKKQNRELATRGILAEVPDSDARVAKIRKAPGAQGAPHKIANDAEFNALPSGTVFIGPDGKQRRKP